MALRVLDMALRRQLAAQVIGKREIVGYGWNGTACYYDRADYPMAAVRCRQPTNEINNLQQKEKKTFAEMQAPTGEFKTHFGVGLLFTAMAIWVAIFMNLFVYDELSITFDEEHKKDQLKRMLDCEMNPHPMLPAIIISQNLDESVLKTS
uniref:Uncharacterized protein n=1 Tax=Glossina austeni TaxID=7395 RepID=A0A1A9VYV1_GLOAU